MSITKPKYQIHICNHIKDMTIIFFFDIFLLAKDHSFMIKQQIT